MSPVRLMTERLIIAVRHVDYLQLMSSLSALLALPIHCCLYN